MVFKNLGEHREFFEPGGPDQPSIVMRSDRLPAFARFLDPEAYRRKFKEGQAADCTTVANDFRLAVRLCGKRQLFHKFWFDGLDNLSDGELATYSKQADGLATLVRLPALQREASHFFRTPRPFGLLVSHSEGAQP